MQLMLQCIFRYYIIVTLIYCLSSVLFNGRTVSRFCFALCMSISIKSVVINLLSNPALVKNLKRYSITLKTIYQLNARDFKIEKNIYVNIINKKNNVAKDAIMLKRDLTVTVLALISLIIPI